MKKITTLFLTCMFALSLSSCDDFLDNKPKGYTIPQYYEDYAFLLNDMNFGFLGVLYPTYITDDLALGGDDAPNPVRFSLKTEPEKGCYIFEHGKIFAEGSNDGFYADCYEQIYTNNVVINNIMDVPDGKEKDKIATKAEAHMGRAFCYFHLVNVYATQYNEATASKDLGVPVITSEDINASYVRNSVQEVYDLILSDMKIAVEGLPEITNNAFHPNKCAAYTFLARVYLYMEKYNEALDASEKALSLNTTAELLDYTKYHINPEAEYRDRIQDEAGNVFPTRAKHPENLYIKLPPNDMASEVFASEDLLKTFSKKLDDASTDKREELFYIKDECNTIEHMVFPGKTMYIAHLLPNCGIMLSEVYLNLAESEARIGNKEKAMEYLKVLRDNRISENKVVTVASNDEALEVVLDERRRETAFWAQTRFNELRRINRNPKTAKEVVHELDGEIFRLPPNDPRYVMLLPYSVTELNPSIPDYER